MPGKPKTPVCSNCGRTGHNKRSCTIVKDEVGNEEPKHLGVVVYEPPMPNKGMWVVSEKFKRIAGKVSAINNKTQEISYQTLRGAIVTSKPHHIRNNDYEFVDNLEPYQLLWENNKK